MIDTGLTHLWGVLGKPVAALMTDGVRDGLKTFDAYPICTPFGNIGKDIQVSELSAWAIELSADGSTRGDIK